MTQPGESDNPVIEKIAAHALTRVRVDLAPAQRCIDVMACCGPEAEHVMVDTYTDRGALFLSPDEADQLAAALIRKARETRDAP